MSVFRNLLIQSFDSKKIPREYQKVQYIESDGNQYINTGYVPTSGTRLYIKASSHEVASHTALFGCRASDYTNPLLSFIELTMNNDTNLIRLDAGGITGNNGSTGVHWVKDEPFTIDVDLYHKKVLVNGNVISKYNSMSYPSSCNVSIGVFAVHHGNTYIYPLAGRVYGCTIYNQDTAVRDLVPCYRKNDGVIGFYDTIGKTFYTNIGSGTFAKGGDLK